MFFIYVPYLYDETDLFYEKHLKMTMKMAIIAVIISKEV